VTVGIFAYDAPRGDTSFGFTGKVALRARATTWLGLPARPFPISRAASRRRPNSVFHLAASEAASAGLTSFRLATSNRSDLRRSSLFSPS